MDPCPFVRILIGNLALRFPPKSHHPSFSYYCKLKFKGFPTHFSDVSPLAADSDAVESKVHACFSLSKPDLERLAERSAKPSPLKIEIHRRSGGGAAVAGCGLGGRGGKLVGCAVVHLDLRGILENMGKCVIENGWVAVGGGSDVKLHLNVRAEPDPRFVFLFDGEPECSPQVFQVNGNVKQPVFTCKFGLRSSTERIIRSR